MTVLTDYFGREITDGLAVCARFPELAAAGRLSVRLDTHGGRFLEGLNPAESYAVLERHAPGAIRRYRSDAELRYLVGTGVSAASIWRMREALDEAGFPRVRIVASSGFGVDKCRVMADAKAPIDVVGTGSFIPENWAETYATADIVEYDGVPMVKVGREFLLRPGRAARFRRVSDLFAPEGGWRVRILDLSAGSADNVVEEVDGFPTLMQANAFARRYVRELDRPLPHFGHDAERRAGSVVRLWRGRGSGGGGRCGLAQRERTGRLRRPCGRGGGAGLARPGPAPDRGSRNRKTGLTDTPSSPSIGSSRRVVVVRTEAPPRTAPPTRPPAPAATPVMTWLSWFSAWTWR